MKRITAVLLLCACCAPPAMPQDAPVANRGEAVPRAPVLQAESSWVGNTFGGANGRWVQDYIDEIEVGLDGSVITASGWDEAGRCTGVYRGGDVNTSLLKQYEGKGGHKSWGWGTASHALALSAEHIVLLNLDGEIVRFNRATLRYIDTTPALDVQKQGDKTVGRAEGLALGEEVLAIVRDNGEVQTRRLSDLKAVASTWAVPNARDVAIDSRGTLWILAGRHVLHFSAEGKALPGRIEALEPTAISIDAQGRLLVCDDAPGRRQVMFYDLSRAPRLSRVFGVPGGIASRARGGPGAVAPDKLFNLAGAGTDAQGNLYVAMSGGENWDGAFIRSFKSNGRGGWGAPAWQAEAHHFLDSLVVDPASDGLVVLGSEERYEMDYARPVGRQWTLRGYTLDPAQKDDPRRTDGSNHAAFARRVRDARSGTEGRLLLYMTSMMPGPLHIYGFEPGSEFASLLYSHKRALKGWGVWADSGGDIWECEGKRIARIRMQGFDVAGKPRFGGAEVVEAPAPFDSLQRVQYFPESDTMYLSGYTPERKEQAWGIVGKVLARFDNWSRGNRAPRWVMDVPHEFAENGFKGIMKEMAIEGGFVFFAGVETKGEVRIFNAETGAFVGVLQPGEAVGGVDSTGWVDMPHSISAFRRKSGEFLVFVEEDYRAKVLMYRWKLA